MAKCKSCSAPLPGSSNICNYCGVRNDVDLQGIHEYTVTVPDSERICPQCNKPMQTIDLNIDGRFLIEQCKDCMGLFFDPGELEVLLEKSVKHIFDIDYMKIQAINSESSVEKRASMYIKCPVCQEMMNRISFGSRSGVIVDRCKAHGIYLDGTELKHLLEWTKAGGQMLNEKRKQEDRANAEKREKAKRSASYTAMPYAGSDIGGFTHRPNHHYNDLDIVRLIGRFVSSLLR